jgi:multicomponent Na+:H+ antiporter subunit G
MNGELVVTVVGSSLLILGAFIIASAAIGLVKLPDLYTRTSAIGTAAGLGIAVIIVGVVVLDFSVLNLVKGVVAIVAQLLTSSIGSFALARAGYLTGSRPAPTTVPDELAESACGENTVDTQPSRPSLSDD